MLLLVGKIDFFQAGDLLGDFLAEQRNVPIVAVAADFQKDPQIFMSHPGVGLDKWADLPKVSTAYVSAGGLYSFYAWMIKAWGFSYANVKTYDFEFRAVHRQQTLDPGGLSYLGALCDRAARPFQTECFPARGSWLFHLLVADRSAAGHGGAESGSGATVRQCFGDRVVSLSLRRQRQSQCGDQTRQSGNDGRPDRLFIAKLKEYGIVDSGDALKLGIGAMTDARVKDFFDEMVKAEIVKPDTDYKKVYTLQFVDKGVGVKLDSK